MPKAKRSKANSGDHRLKPASRSRMRASPNAASRTSTSCTATPPRGTACAIAGGASAQPRIAAPAALRCDRGTARRMRAGVASRFPIFLRTPDDLPCGWENSASRCRPLVERVRSGLAAHREPDLETRGTPQPRERDKEQREDEPAPPFGAVLQRAACDSASHGAAARTRWPGRAGQGHAQSEQRTRNMDGPKRGALRGAADDQHRDAGAAEVITTP